MNRRGFLKLAAAIAAAPYVGRLEKIADTLAPAIAADTTTLTVAGGAGWASVGDIVRVTSTGEAMMVTAIDGATWTVRRGIGAIAPQQLERGSLLRRVAAMASEGGQLPDVFPPRLATAVAA